MKPPGELGLAGAGNALGRGNNFRGTIGSLLNKRSSPI
jgi:hypothetical protein